MLVHIELYFLVATMVKSVKIFGVVLYALYLLMGSREVTKNEGRDIYGKWHTDSKREGFNHNIRYAFKPLGQ